MNSTVLNSFDNKVRNSKVSKIVFDLYEILNLLTILKADSQYYEYIEDFNVVISDLLMIIKFFESLMDYDTTNEELCKVR